MRLSVSTLFIGVAGLVATVSGQTYSLSVQGLIWAGECRSPGPDRCSDGVLSATARDRVEVVVGSPFDVDHAAGQMFYRKSGAAIDGGSVTLYNRVQVAGFPHWPREPKPADWKIVGVAHVVLDDVLTVTGAAGKGYLLPTYHFLGRITRSEYSYLDAYTSAIPGIPGAGGRQACRSHGWMSATRPIDYFRRPSRGLSQSYGIDELYKFECLNKLEFEFGVPFHYVVTCASVIECPFEYGLMILDFGARDEFMMDFSRIELRGVAVLNPKGEPVLGAAISSRSGIQYNIQMRVPDSTTEAVRPRGQSH